MPRLWNDTIAGHKAALREAILDAADHAVSGNGIPALTMSKLADDAGIGRATLYKYFPDLEAVVRAWHARQVTRHVAQLTQSAPKEGSPVERLTHMLHAYVQLRFGHHGDHGHHGDRSMLAHLHRTSEVVDGESAISELLANIVLEGQELGNFRSDFTAEQLARFCLGAVSAAQPMGPGQHRIIHLAVQAIQSKE